MPGALPSTKHPWAFLLGRCLITMAGDGIGAAIAQTGRLLKLLPALLDLAPRVLPDPPAYKLVLCGLQFTATRHRLTKAVHRNEDL